MSARYVLDTSPLGRIAARPSHAAGRRTVERFDRAYDQGATFYVPSAAYFEVRRELVRIGSPTVPRLSRSMQEHER